MKRNGNGIGIGHNSGVHEVQAPRFHNTGQCVLDYDPKELARKRQFEAAQLTRRAPVGKPLVSPATHACRPNDHRSRVNSLGQCRCHIGTADDLTTAAKDDTLADHLVLADERFFDDGVYEDPEDEEANSEKALEPEEEPEESILPPGVLYSTASGEHRRNLAEKES